ncbi:3-hydroxyanthranilate 3,4-dioxygenase-like [Lineus longissimus]|uniref:3-hydroxyanthranilate 3,4-dioxygenase-like n=1 Tax=Lineus longissimus TaxID=88925 RepID=UPI00315CC7A1
MSSTPVFYNIPEWIEEKKDTFLPPVCNSMMHNLGQMKAFYVGGPNQRKDYHIEEGEELFYMLKGDMCLKIVEQNKHRDIIIKEGEIFLLPGMIAHSPNRVADTLGLVIERERLKEPLEQDGLRYYYEENGKPTLNSLYEKWFYCDDLGTQLAPVIKGFFASEQFKTGKPLPGTIPENPPITLDSKRKLTDPFSLQEWIKANREKIDCDGHKSIFGHDFQFEVDIYGKGENSGQCDTAEIWIWQLEGSSSVSSCGKTYDLKKDDSLLIPVGECYTATRPEGSLALICYQDPRKKARSFKHLN